MAVLGVKVTPDTAWLAAVRDGAVDEKPDRYELPNLPRAQALESAIDQVARLYEQEGVTAVAVLDAHGNTKPRSFKAARGRLTLELVFELAAARVEIPFAVMAPVTIQSRLSLSSRRIEDHVDNLLAPAGTRWNHRGSAAVTALAFARGED